MPPSPLPFSALTWLLQLLFSFLTTTTTLNGEAVVAAAAHGCSSSSSASCPPFTSAPPFPFSSSPGCGHPSFQILCSSPNAIISINNVSFSLLHYEPSSSLLLSPETVPPPQSAGGKNCSAQRNLAIPNRPISLSGSPFRVSDSSCSRISALKSCLPPYLPNCSHCPWECKLIKNPIHLLHGCGSRDHQDSQQGCQSDVLGFLDKFLKWGIEVEWDEQDDDGDGGHYFSNCKACRASHGFCGYNSSHPEKPFLCFPSSSQSRTSAPQIREKGANRVAMLCIVFLCVCFLIFLSIGTVVVRSRQKALVVSEDPTIVFLRRHRSASLLPPVFTYEELEASTNHFDHKRKIGDGGFGSVYLGQLYDGRIVAVKYLHKHNPNIAAGGGKAFSKKSFCNEILILSSINHPNLVKLHGYCSDPRGLLLVYEYVPNGSLSDHLHGAKNLYRNSTFTWNLRVEIALQTAMAIEYLHFSVFPPVVHRDITSSNIFIEKDMRVKVGDFGLSRLLVCSEKTMHVNDSSGGGVWTGPQGTPGYLDPDYYRSFILNEKSDIYSFGVVLLELITGMRAVDQKREKREIALADMVVARIQMGLLHQVIDPMLVVNDGDGREAVSVFQHARIYDATTKQLKHIKPIPEELLASLDGELDFLGPEMTSSVATAIAQGHLNPCTMEAFDHLPSSKYLMNSTNTIRTNLRQRGDEVALLPSKDGCFTTISSRICRKGDSAKEGKDHSEEKFIDKDLELEKLLPLITQDKEESITIIPTELQKIPDNNPFKKRKLEEMKLDWNDSSTEPMSVVTEVEKSEIMCFTSDSQQSVDSKPVVMVVKDDHTKKANSGKKAKRTNRQCQSPLHKKNTILNFFSRV